MPSLDAINDSSPLPAASWCRAVSPLVLGCCTLSHGPGPPQLLGVALSPVLSCPAVRRHPPGPGCKYLAPWQHALKTVAAVAVAAVTAATTAPTATATAAAVTVAVAAAVTMTAAVTATVTAITVSAAAAAAVVTVVPR